MSAATAGNHGRAVAWGARRLGLKCKIFISEHVSERRGKRVEGKKIFNGEVWEAERAKKLGLIDDIGTMEDILESKYGEDIKYKYVNKKKSIFSR